MALRIFQPRRILLYGASRFHAARPGVLVPRDDELAGLRAWMRLPPGDTVAADRYSDALRGEHMPERTEE